jgi:phosphoketolase
MTTLAKKSETLNYDEKKSAISAYGPARSTIKGAPLSSEELQKIDAYWRASLYLSLGMLYLKENPLLREPLRLEQTKPRLLGAEPPDHRIGLATGPQRVYAPGPRFSGRGRQ